MSVIVSIRNGDISETLKSYAKDKTTLLVDNYPKITSTRVILDTKKSRYKAEVVIRGKNLNIEADNESFDMYDSIDTAIEKANVQLRKHFDKVQDHYKPAKLPKNHDNENDQDEVDDYLG